LPLLRQKPEQLHYSASDELSHDEDQNFLAEVLAIANAQPVGEEASAEEILASLDDGKVDNSINPQPVEVDNSANPNPAQVDNSAKKSRTVSLLRDAAFLRAIEGLFASRISLNQAGTSVTNTSPLHAPSRRTRSRTPWWRIFQGQPPRSYRIEAVCKMNSIPFDGTGERIERDGLWCVYEFAVQLDAIQFWDRFDGRWLRGEEFIYPDRPKGLPELREPPDMFKFGRRPAGR
jgi:hypothetical protein